MWGEELAADLLPDLSSCAQAPFQAVCAECEPWLAAPAQLSQLPAQCSASAGPLGTSVTSPEARLPLLCQVWELKLFLWKGNKVNSCEV